MKGFVILYRGDASPSDMVTEIGKVLQTFGVKDPVDVTCLDDKDVANVLTEFTTLQLAIDVPSTGLHKESVLGMSPEDHAAVYLGTMFESIFVSNVKGTKLMTALANGIKDLKNLHEERRKVLNAMKILSGTRRASPAILKKYHLTGERISVIKDTYNIIMSASDGENL